jgi:ATP-dependent exoDNAse (exonuclease V) alpha subunit
MAWLLNSLPLSQNSSFGTPRLLFDRFKVRTTSKQVRDFLEKIRPHDRVLLIGDTRQHQGVDAGKPFEQLQQAGMTTAVVDQIVRQKEPGLLRAVEHLSKGEIAQGIAALHRQGSITEIANSQERIEAIAKNYATRPENTIIVSPDNASRREINQAVRLELRALGILHPTDHAMTILAPRSAMTGADSCMGGPVSRWGCVALPAWQQGHRHRAAQLHSGCLPAIRKKTC